MTDYVKDVLMSPILFSLGRRDFIKVTEYYNKISLKNAASGGEKRKRRNKITSKENDRIHIEL